MSTDKYTCPNCQNEVRFGDKFCGKCGFRFGDWGGIQTTGPENNNSMQQANGENKFASQQGVANQNLNPDYSQNSSNNNNGNTGIFGKLVKWAVIILVAGGVIAFVSSFFGVSSPQEAIKEGDKEAMETYYKKAKDKTKAKAEMGKAFLEEAYRILEGDEFKNSSSKQLEAQNKLLNATETFVMNDELQELGKARSAFKDIAVANSQSMDAENNIWKKYKVTANSTVRRIDGYVLNKVQNSNSQYQCVQYEYLFGEAVPQINNPICVLDFGNYGYPKQGAQVVYGVKDTEADFTDRAGFKTRMTIYKVVDEGVFTELGNAKRIRATKKYKESEFKRLYPKDYFDNGSSVTKSNANVDASGQAPSASSSVPSISSGKITNTTQSSADNENGYVHSAALTVDGDIKTCWTEGVKGLGIGEYIQIYFNGTYKVSGLNIWAGHQKSQDLFYKNARPVAIRVIGSDGSNAVYPLEDKMGMQRVNFTSPINVSDIKIVVEKAARGNKYEDTCIGEVSFF